jgi:4-diphosphocytidyl-2-C-methyl-D-erythritol kinase
MRTITIRSFAKLNLTFEILENLPGGYHDIRTLFQSIDLADTLSFTLERTGSERASAEQASPAQEFAEEEFAEQEFAVEIRRESNYSLPDSDDDKAAFPLNDQNLIVKAAKRFEQISHCGSGQKLIVSVNKQIPIAAGMAGGSGNAAATIRAMQEFFPEHCSQEVGEQVASALGSDINFCLYGGTQIGTNRGEVLSPCTNPNLLSFLIVKPRDIAISTPWIFRQYDESLATSQIDDTKINYTAACCEALTKGSQEQLVKTFFNAFEKVCFEKYPEVQILRDAMLAAGCLSAHITGSGPTLFGLLPSKDSGTKVGEQFQKLASQSSFQTGFHSWISSSETTGLAVLSVK